MPNQTYPVNDEGGEIDIADLFHPYTVILSPPVDLGDQHFEISHQHAETPKDAARYARNDLARTLRSEFGEDVEPALLTVVAVLEGYHEALVLEAVEAA